MVSSLEDLACRWPMAGLTLKPSNSGGAHSKRMGPWEREGRDQCQLLHLRESRQGFEKWREMEKGRDKKLTAVWFARDTVACLRTATWQSLRMSSSRLSSGRSSNVESSR